VTGSHVEPVPWRQVCETPNGDHAARVVVWTNAEHLVHDRMPRMLIRLRDDSSAVHVVDSTAAKGQSLITGRRSALGTVDARQDTNRTVELGRSIDS
jgi:hypothetical protein